MKSYSKTLPFTVLEPKMSFEGIWGLVAKLLSELYSLCLFLKSEAYPI